MTDPREALIDNYLRDLKMPGLKRTYRALSREALDEGKHPLDFLSACLSAEVESRREHRLQARLHSARFPSVKTLDAFDFSAIPGLPKPKVLDLARGEFIRAKENVVCLGGSGAGKTHIAIAIGLAAIEAGYRVRFIQAITLAQELLQAQQEYRLPKYLKTWHAADLVIVDELGYLGLGPGGPLLFQFCADRYERGSFLVRPVATPTSRSMNASTTRTCLMPHSSATIPAVSAVRESGLVRTRSHLWCRTAPALWRAWSRPRSFRGMSLRPWKIPSRLAAVSLCLIRQIFVTYWSPCSLTRLVLIQE